MRASQPGGNEGGGQDFLLVFILCIVGFVLGRMQTSARNDGRVDLFGKFVQTAVNPPARLTSAIADATGDFFHGIASARSLTRENRQLMAQLGSIAMYTETVERLNQEINNLRKMEDFPEISGKQRIPAEITGYFPNENRLTLDVGRNQGVSVGAPVVAPDGMLGRIQVVGASTSQVLLLSSPDSKNRIGAILPSHTPPLAGLLRGESATSYVLDFSDPHAPVAMDDLVVTSGFSEHIPRGIPLGRVIQIIEDKEFGKLQATVRPSVSMGSVREVFVLK